MFVCLSKSVFVCYCCGVTIADWSEFVVYLLAVEEVLPNWIGRAKVFWEKEPLALLV